MRDADSSIDIEVTTDAIASAIEVAPGTIGLSAPPIATSFALAGGESLVSSSSSRRANVSLQWIELDVARKAIARGQVNSAVPHNLGARRDPARFRAGLRSGIQQ
jgi:hypothetical protein